MIVFLCKRSNHSIGVQTSDKEFLNILLEKRDENEEESLKKTIKDYNNDHPEKVE